MREFWGERERNREFFRVIREFREFREMGEIGTRRPD
jgi:hypothetical protein